MLTKELIEKYDVITDEDANNNYFSLERVLWNLLKANETEIIKHQLLEEDETGYWFHKAFRQIDVTGNANTDMAIWLLLRKAPLFWKLVNDNNPNGDNED